MRKVLYIFGLLSDMDIEWMARTGVRRRLKDGEVVIEEGVNTEHVVLLLEGELLVTASGFGEIDRLGIGEIVGEISLVDSAPPSASVTARGDCQALFLDKPRLMRKIDSDPSFGCRFYHALAVVLADRLRATRRLPSIEGGIMGEDILEDELDPGILDRLGNAGDRFHRMIRLLNG